MRGGAKIPSGIWQKDDIHKKLACIAEWQCGFHTSAKFGVMIPGGGGTSTVK